MQLYKQTSTIPKGKSEGGPVFTKGARVRRLGLPTDENGSIALSGTQLSFEGSIDGTHWFTVNDSKGLELKLSARAAQLVVSNVGLDTAPAHLPIQEPSLFEGIQMLRVRSNLVEEADRSIEIYFEPTGP